MNYYNEFDPKAAMWLRELIKQGLIPNGIVDERSISDVTPNDLSGFIQCHFFAGIGGWALALALAGWPEDRPAWTGSCPCPPFSSAGKKKWCPICQGKPIPHPLKTGIFACVACGHEWFADGRHLWPEFYRLIGERRPTAVFGEQVAGADGLIWLAGVRATMEALGYGFGGADLCAAGVGSPHIRQRLYWMANAKCDAGEPGRIADEPSEGFGTQGKRAHAESGRCGVFSGVADAMRQGFESESLGLLGTGYQADGRSPFADGGAWGAFDILPCLDGKARRIESGTFPLAHGVPGRVGLLRGYGNAIVPEVAAEFIKASGLI